jgi:hypothetical protein
MMAFSWMIYRAAAELAIIYRAAAELAIIHRTFKWHKSSNRLAFNAILLVAARRQIN